MFKNYLTTTLRSLFKHKLNSFINILGLSIGLASAITIFMWAGTELSYDNFWPSKERVYRVETHFHAPGTDPNFTATSGGPNKAAFMKNFSEVELATNFFYRGVTAKLGETLVEEGVLLADENFFNVLEFKFLEGDPENALIELTSIVISEDIATKYFGTQSALNKTITIDDVDYQVRGVFPNLPQNTHLSAQIISRYNENTRSEWLKRWFWTNFYTYIRLKPEANIQNINDGITAMRDRELKPHMVELGIPYEPHEVIDIYLVALEDIHLKSAKNRNITPPGSLLNVYTSLILAVFILILASINFINLSTARASQRAPEVALRKVMGGSKSDLMKQFLGESIFTTLISYVIALGLVQLTLPFISNTLGILLETQGAFWIQTVIFGLIGSIVLGALSGLYPALLLSTYSPAKILGSNKTTGNPQSPLRQALVTFQFAISIILILMTIIVVQQNRYASSFDMGFSKENKVVVNAYAVNNHSTYESLKNALLNNPETLGVSRSNNVPGQGSEYMDGVFLPGEDKSTPISVQQVDFGFFETYGATLLAGRAFDDEFQSDVLRENYEDGYKESANIILNEAALRKFGYESAEVALGQQFRMELGDGRRPLMTIIGIVKDIHYRSLHSIVRPMLFVVDLPQFYNMTVSFKGNNLQGYLDFIDATWNDFIPDEPISRRFIEDYLSALYENDQKAAEAIKIFAGLAIIISILGLYGLASYNISQRTREIGIRKVLGAEVIDIIKLLLWQFSRPVMVANFIAWPVAFYALENWLQNFAFRIDISLLVFLAASITALMVAWVTVGTHAYKVAKTKPIKALRYE